MTPAELRTAEHDISIVSSLWSHMLLDRAAAKAFAEERKIGAKLAVPPSRAVALCEGRG